MYSVYEASWGFSPITVTVVFGAYAVAVLVALLTVGSLSDHVGRRPVVLVGLVIQIGAMVLFALAHSVAALLAARILQGLSTGATVGALGAGMLDLDRARGTIANAVAPPAGTAVGALASGLLVAYLPQPTHLVVSAHRRRVRRAGARGAGDGRAGDDPAGALASLRPRFSLPPRARGPFLIVAPTLVAVWAIAAFYLSLGPALVAQITGTDSAALGGLTIFALQGTASAAVLAIRGIEPRTATIVGASSLIVGVAVSLLAVWASSLALLVIGTAAAGVGFGAGFQGGLRTVVPLAGPAERAGVLSTVYALCYLALGVPVVVAGGTRRPQWGGDERPPVRRRGDRPGGRHAVRTAATRRHPDAVDIPRLADYGQRMSEVDQVRRFNRTVTERVGALDERFLGGPAPRRGAAAVGDRGSTAARYALLRARLGLDSGYVSRLLRSLEAAGLVEVAASDADRRRSGRAAHRCRPP